ncbi:MAG: hypothetical protein EPN72_10830 [Nevskiaceae bacterium]|nr:MAG: hypothetical protein EPN63_05840 [Nevskiaceae bacterium]TBR72239.1 MAG: hypothetical protein EPN72_10830 [Nevskiaceae bacterium]
MIDPIAAAAQAYDDEIQLSDWQLTFSDAFLCYWDNRKLGDPLAIGLLGMMPPPWEAPWLYTDTRRRYATLADIRGIDPVSAAHRWYRHVQPEIREWRANAINAREFPRTQSQCVDAL